MDTQCFVCCIPIPILLSAVFLSLPRFRARVLPPRLRALLTSS